MSFADELRRATAAPVCRLDEKRVEACVQAIKDACMQERLVGHLEGYLDEYNDDGIMRWRIIPEPKMLSKEDVNRWESGRSIYPGERNLYIVGKGYGMNQASDPAFKVALQRKLDELGFRSAILKTVQLEQRKETIWQAWGGYRVKYEKTGESFNALYVEICW